MVTNKVDGRLLDVRTRLEQAGEQGVGQAITLGSMAAGGVGGPKNPVLAEACFLPVFPDFSCFFPSSARPNSSAWPSLQP